jgi:predicted heme/steroid binding protein
LIRTDTVSQLGPISLTEPELSLYNGTDPKLPIYVGLNGQIYDVSAANQTYGPGGSYSFFAGRDAARSFLTGCFKDDLTGDLRGVEEMFMPLDSDQPAEGEKRGAWKIRREQDKRDALRQVKEGIEQWAKVLRGDTGRPYFWVGTIMREEGWPSGLPMPTLCEPAQEARPTSKQKQT